MQNEILSIMALHILKDITADIYGKWFTLMVDETTDVSNTTIGSRVADNDLKV